VPVGEEVAESYACGATLCIYWGNFASDNGAAHGYIALTGFQVKDEFYRRIYVELLIFSTNARAATAQV
jgi:hypothetical protein